MDQIRALRCEWKKDLFKEVAGALQHELCDLYKWYSHIYAGCLASSLFGATFLNSEWR